jgi:tetratricopeptide (TPR) repeat protein
MLGIVLFIGLPNWCLADSIKAFSLREANLLLKNGNVVNEEIRTLGGITRLAGMVFDRKTGDIILVGKTRKDLPPTTIDDLAVTLRCRLLKGQYPRVSIDMDEETAKTGMQDVRFEGGIEETKFGSDFLESDVILKRYSLDLLRQIHGVEPYLKLYEIATRKQMAEEGHPVEQVKWFSEEESGKIVEQYVGKKASEKGIVQSRFWFHVIDDESFIVEQDDVYVIEELRLGVKTETILQRGVDASGKKVEGGRDDVGEEFSRQFTEHYHNACSEHPLLKRLKVMFDLVCIAEGVAQLGDERPDLDYLLHRHHVQSEATPERYPLVHRVGEFHGKDDVSVLAQLSGGISLEAILLALEDGDVNGLKMAVLRSRPDKHSLCWTLPLDEWKMPNDEPGNSEAGVAASRKELRPKDLGFAVSVQKYVFDPARPGNETLKFKGFPAPPATKHTPVSNPKFRKLERLRTVSKSSIDIEDVTLKKAILAENWEKVADLLDKVDAQSPSPVLRYIKGHACLATNRNNESLSLFFMMSLEDLKKWAEWCETFVSQNKTKSIAYYFLGDIYSRVGDLDQSFNHFSKAIEIDKENYLAWNARGVISTLRKKYDNSMKDFTKSLSIKYDFVDARNNLGMMRIRQGQGRKGARARFLSVIDLDNKHALAHHGLGCLELLKAQEMDPEKNKNIEKALELLPNAKELFIENHVRFADAYLEKQAAVLIADAGEEGTAIKKDYKISQLSAQYKKYEQILNDPSANIVQKTRAAFGSDRTKLQLSNHANRMSQGEMNRLALKDPTVLGIMGNAVSARERNLKTQQTFGNAYHSFYKYVVNPTIGKAPIIGSHAKTILDGANDHLRNQFKIRHNNALEMKHRFVTAQDYYINQHIKNGTFDGKTYRMQNPDRRSGMSEYTPSQSPAGYADKLGVSKGIPGQRDTFQGATTNKAHVIWDDNEWPFMPIFGLLYPVPQANSESDGD